MKNENLLRAYELAMAIQVYMPDDKERIEELRGILRELVIGEMHGSITISTPRYPSITAPTTVPWTTEPFGTKITCTGADQAYSTRTDGLE